MDWATSGSRKEISNHHRARRLLAVSCFLCGALLLTLAGCDTEGVVVSDDSSELETALRILGSDSAILAHSDVEHEFSVMTDLISERGAGVEDLEQLMAEVYAHTGIQLDENLHGAYFGVSELEEDASGALVAFVDFDQGAVIEKFLEESEVTSLDSQWPVDAYALGPHESAAVAFVEGTMVILSSDAEHLELLLDRTYNESAATLPSSQLFEEISEHYNWALIRDIDAVLNSELDFNLDLEGEGSMLIPVVRSVRHIGVGVSTDGESFEMEMYLAPTSEIQAGDLKSVLSGVKGIARLQFHDNDELKALVEKFDIEESNGLVQVSIEVDRDDLENFENAFKSEFEGRKSRSER